MHIHVICYIVNYKVQHYSGWGSSPVYVCSIQIRFTVPSIPPTRWIQFGTVVIKTWVMVSIRCGKLHTIERTQGIPGISTKAAHMKFKVWHFVFDAEAGIFSPVFSAGELFKLNSQSCRPYNRYASLMLRNLMFDFEKTIHPG